MATYVDSATGGTYTTGAGGVLTSGAAKSGGGINPATGRFEGGSNNDTTPNAMKGFQPLPQMSLDQARRETDKAF